MLASRFFSGIFPFRDGPDSRAHCPVVCPESCKTASCLSSSSIPAATKRNRGEIGDSCCAGFSTAAPRPAVQPASASCSRLYRPRRRVRLAFTHWPHGPEAATLPATPPPNWWCPKVDVVPNDAPHGTPNRRPNYRLFRPVARGAARAARHLQPSRGRRGLRRRLGINAFFKWHGSGGQFYDFSLVQFNF